MSTVKVEIQLSLEQLLKAVEQLSQQDLENFVSQVIALQAQRRTQKPLESKGGLLTKINRPTPLAIKKYHGELVAKKDVATLTSYEYGELLGLTEQIEQLQAQYLDNLAELASPRGVSLSALIESLNIQTRIYEANQNLQDSTLAEN
ncbi:STAS/SEC14 domain-containing protein [Calothrix membranacea FACHB-236]|nr:STAS/SEC14 domain-containing protein [Calothrix membranacea FACHB-236]